MSEVNPVAPDSGNEPQAAPQLESPVVKPVESLEDALLRDMAEMASRKEPEVTLDILTRPLPPPPSEEPVAESVVEPVEAVAEPVAEPVAEVVEAAETAEAAEATQATEEEDVLAEIAEKRKKARAKKPAGAPKRKSSRAKPDVEDLGDGSGYIAPVRVAVEEVPQESGEEGMWYAVHCYSGQENKVKTNLEQRIETMGMAGRILEVVVPTEEEMEVKDGKRRTVERRVFPGYILVKMKMSEEAWFVVRNTPGVTRFVGMGNRPAPLTPQEVDQILRRMEAEAPKLKVNYRPGQKVRITDGPFADFMGVVDKIDTERAKVSVLVSFFGRETPVELDFLQVERM